MADQMKSHPNYSLFVELQQAKQELSQVRDELAQANDRATEWRSQEQQIESLQVQLNVLKQCHQSVTPLHQPSRGAGSTSKSIPLVTKPLTIKKQQERLQAEINAKILQQQNHDRAAADKLIDSVDNDRHPVDLTVDMPSDQMINAADRDEVTNPTHPIRLPPASALPDWKKQRSLRLTPHSFQGNVSCESEQSEMQCTYRRAVALTRSEKPNT